MKISFYFVVPALCVLLYSCNTKKAGDGLLDASRDQELLDKYFMAGTVGMISTHDPLKYVLKEPITNIVTNDDLQKVISLDPSVEGKVTLSSNTLLVFTPTQPLKSGETYTVNLNLKSLDNKIFDEDISYKIKTFAQDLQTTEEGFVLNDDGSVSVFVGIKTADKVSIDNLKTCFQTDAPTLSVTERQTSEYLAEFRYPKLYQKDSYITWDGNNIGVDAKGKISLFDIDQKNFKVVHNFHNVADKTFNIYFSQKLNRQMDLTGLLKVQNENTSYTIKNNVLTIFLGELSNFDRVNISLNKNIRSADGKILAADENFELTLMADKPEAAFVSDGNYFPSEGDFKIPIKTKALDQLRIVVIEIKQENVMHYLAWQSVTYSDYYNLRMYGKPVYDQVVSLNKGIKDSEGWTVHGIDLTSKIKKNPGNIYHITMDFAPENTSLSCRKDLQKYKFNSQVPKAEFFEIRDNYYEDYYAYYDDYNWQESGNPCKLTYYLNRQPVHRMFICSDYAVIAKKAGQNYNIALSKLLDLSHVGDAEVTLYNLQAEKMATAKTSSEGFVEFIQVKGEASVLKISKNNQITYLALDPNQSNTLTEFDITGERSETETEFFIYTDREVWRPGDSIYVDYMINNNNTNLPDGLPLVMTFYNTENHIIGQQIQKIQTDKKLIYNFTLHTPPSAKTGVYRCVFQVGPKTLHKNIRIETIKPNTAEVLYSFANMSDNVVYDDKLAGTIAVKYLTGFEISNAAVIANARAKKINQPFADFKDYTFDVLDNPIFENNINVLDVVTNQDGQGAFNSTQDLKSFNTPLTLSIETETILPGGGTNKEGKSIGVSPFDTYIGAKRKEGSGWSGNHTFSENIEVALVNVSNKGKTVNQNSNISYTLQKHTESWWVDKYRLRSSGNFVNGDYWQDVDSGNIPITGKGKFTLPKGKLGRGAYKLTFTDTRSGHSSQSYFTVYDGAENIPGAQPYLVEFQTDKEMYNTGETVTLRMPDMEDAKVLVSIERGNKVISQSWFTLGKSNNTIQLKSNTDWSPNVYIHATIMQKYMQENNDLPLRMYGIKHIKINSSELALKPVATLPDKMESNKTYNFTVSEATGQPMEYTIAIVDEGLLNLTGFATPDPLKHFNGKFPLLVKTWDIYQYLINYFRGRFAGIISIGGDDVYNPDAIAEINRFKPLVFHQGSFNIGKGGKNTHSITIPNYAGRVRLMVVSCNDKNFGKLEKAIPVKNPIMVQSQLPRALNVSDKLTLPVTILRDDPTISSANLVATVDPSRTKGFVGNKTINFNGKNQFLHNYDIEVLDKTGKMTVDLEVKSGNKSMKESTDIMVNYPNSYTSTVTKNSIEYGATLSVTAKSKGYPEVFTSSMTISGVKLPNFAQYASELIGYPYGCLEQTTSSGFGQLYLDKILVLDPKDNLKRVENLQISLARISSYQQSSGKFNYWTGSYYHAWSDIYAANFLVEMKNLGYLGNQSDMLSRWLDVQVSTANNWALAEASNEYIYESESLTQAYRLFVLAKGGKSAKSALNRFVTSSKSKNPVTWWLIAGSLQLSSYDSKAKEMVAKAESLQKMDGNGYNSASFGDSGRDLAITVEVLSYMPGMTKKADTYYDQMVDVLNSQGWVSTHTKGYAFIAAYKYFGYALQVTGKVDFAISGLENGQKSYSLSAFEPKYIKLDKSTFNKKITIQNKGKAKLYVYQVDRYISKDLNVSPSSNNLGLSVEYYNTTKRQNNKDGVQLGDDLIISVKVNNPSALEIKDMALNLKMPAGLELLNPRMYETETNTKNGNYTYQDFRDDRVYTFFNLKAGGTETFTFKAKAAFTGDFYNPATSCENMYNGTIYANSGTSRMVISR